MTAAPRRGLLVGLAKEVDDCFALLRRHGWSLGVYATAATWSVEAGRGDALVIDTGPTRADAGRAAVAGALGHERP